MKALLSRSTMKTPEKVAALITQMRWNLDVIVSSKNPEMRNKYYALIGSEADELSELIQYFLKFGDEE